MTDFENRRVLIVEDNESIHEDYRKILQVDDASPQLDAERAAFFGDDTPRRDVRVSYELEFAPQGEIGLAMVKQALEEGRPYAMCFVDVRMPPGWDGIKTIEEIWTVDQEIQTVICTAFSDYSWEDVSQRLGLSDRLLILKKPFDPVEVRQLAAALTAKWSTRQRAAHHLGQVEEHAESLERINRELDRASQRAQAADRAKSEFLANVSHEIRTPMNAIFGYADLIGSGETSDDERQECVETIKGCCTQLLSCLDDIIDISTIQAGDMVLSRETCSPYAMLGALRTRQQARCRESGLSLDIECVGPIPEFIQTDPRRLKQVLTKLLDNAIQFTEEGGVTLRCSLQEHDASGDDGEPGHGPLLRIDVIDTGVGIDASQHSQMFEAFTQADSSSTRTVGGLGLGLAIAKSVAQMLGGDIELDSRPGEGSCFSLTVDVGELEGRMLEMKDGVMTVRRDLSEVPAPLPGTAQAPNRADTPSVRGESE